MLNKKALSNVITTVLILLLALAASVIAWQFVRPILTSPSQTILLQQECLAAEVTPVSCNYVDTAAQAIAIVKQTRGKIAGIAAVLEFSDGTRKVFTQPSFAEAGTATFTFKEYNNQPLHWG